MTTANGTKPKTKRPITIYDCSPEQHTECDYKYLARVWFFRTLVIVIASSVGVGGSMLWKTAEWKNDQENRIETHNNKILFLESRNENYDSRIKKLENIKSDLDSLKSWSRPNK
jgi:hypothetical protein